MCERPLRLADYLDLNLHLVFRAHRRDNRRASLRVSLNSETSAVLPISASPLTCTVHPRPAAASAWASSSDWNAGSRSSSFKYACLARGDLFDRPHTSIHNVLSRTGGIRPPERRRSKAALSLSERGQPRTR